MTLTARFTPLAPGIAYASLSGHPCPRMLVYTHRLAPDELAVALWEGDHEGDRDLRGGGVLRQRDGRWEGECSEGRAIWRVSGVAGAGVLEFGEK